MTSDKPKTFESSDSSNDGWEREVLRRLALAAVNEQRRARRWGIFFKFLLFGYLILLLLLYRPGTWMSDGIHTGKHTALVELEGIIGPKSLASADQVIQGLRAAFKDKHTKGIVLRINSPGGSPVQSGYINDEIRRLREKYPDTPLYAVVTDMCASGGYYVAVAADEIYVDKASVIGSIGVRMDGFGFVEAIDKLGVERRLLTAGEHKGFLDPFLPERQEDVSHVQGLLDQIHQQFIDRVREGRGERLAADDSIFSGLIWTGEQSVELGLVDGLGSASYVARELIGAEEIVDFTPRPDFFERFSERFGVALGNALVRLAGEGPSLR